MAQDNKRGEKPRSLAELVETYRGSAAPDHSKPCYAVLMASKEAYEKRTGKKFTGWRNDKEAEAFLTRIVDAAQVSNAIFMAMAKRIIAENSKAYEQELQKAPKGREPRPDEFWRKFLTDQVPVLRSASSPHEGSRKKGRDGPGGS